MFSYHARQAPSSSKFWCTFCILIHAIQPNPWIPVSKFAGTNALKLQRRKAINYRGADAMQFCVHPILTNEQTNPKQGVASVLVQLGMPMELHLQSRSWRDQNNTWTLLEQLALEIGWAGTFWWAFATWGRVPWSTKYFAFGLLTVFSMALLDIVGSMYAQLNCSNEVWPGVAWAAKRWSQHCHNSYIHFGILRAMSDEKQHTCTSLFRIQWYDLAFYITQITTYKSQDHWPRPVGWLKAEEPWCSSRKCHKSVSFCRRAGPFWSTGSTMSKSYCPLPTYPSATL